MLKKVAMMFGLAIMIISCQFTETMILNEDGSGSMAIEIDMGEMMAFGGMSADTAVVKMDTIISMKEVLEEKKDSIAQLSNDEQEQLQKMENYNIRMIMDSETSELLMNLSEDFKNVNEVNDFIDGFGKTSGFMPNMGNDISLNQDDSSSDITGVKYSYKKGKFKRDAFIKDKEKHRAQVDSLKSAESWMSGMKYTLKYTFPRKIVKSSIDDATYSLDGKTIEVTRGIIAYLKDPDVLDLEVELEKK